VHLRYFLKVGVPYKNNFLLVANHLDIDLTEKKILEKDVRLLSNEAFNAVEGCWKGVITQIFDLFLKSMKRGKNLFVNY